MGQVITTHKIFYFLDRYLFKYSRTPSLGLLRIAVVASCAYQIYTTYHSMKKLVELGMPYDALHQPSMLIRLLHVPFPLPAEYQTVFAYFFYFVALCALFGIFTRPALFLFGLMYIYIVDIDASRGFFDHEASLSTQIILVLALVPGSTSYSVDRLIKWILLRYKNKNAIEAGHHKLLPMLAGPPVPVWGVKLLLLMLAITYFTSGLSKVRFTGWQWLNGETLGFYLDGRAGALSDISQLTYVGPKQAPDDKKWKDGFGLYSYSYGNWQKSPFWRKIGKEIADNRGLIIGFSVATVLFEMSGWVLLLGGWIRVFYLLGAIILHMSIGFLMNLPFTTYQATCFFLLDWKWIYNHLPNFIRQRIHPVVAQTRLLLSKI